MTGFNLGLNRPLDVKYLRNNNMKIKNIIWVMLFVFVGLLSMQSCVKQDNSTFTTFHAFTDPVVTAPLDASTVKITGTTIDLKWTSTNADGDPILCDVYFGTDPNPVLYKTGFNALTMNVPVAKGNTYYWRVVMKDKNGITSTGPVWSFTIFEPIGVFVGTYNVDEPAEGWNYDVSFVKLSDNSLQIGNNIAGKYDGWWASWTAVFTLDFAKNTYSMPKQDFSGGYAGEESGTIDPATGTMVGNYTIWQTKAGVTSVIEEGVHTYTKK
jgi:hypothetical protein